MNERPMRADALRNRIRILTAAEVVFAAKGLDAATDEIARLAGVSIGTLYRHFTTKGALVDAVFAGRMQRLADHAAQLGRESNPGRALRDLFTATVGASARDRPLDDPLNRAGFDAEAVTAYADHPFHGALTHLLARAQRSGQVRRDVREVDVVALMAGAVRAMRHAGAGDRAAVVIVDGLCRTGPVKRR
jgi:AcrR family transcriptional regulator